MQNGNSFPQDVTPSASASKSNTRTRLAIINMVIVGAIIKDLLAMCVSVEETTLPLVMIGLFYDVFLGSVAWGLWQRKEFARKGLIAVVAINALSFVFGLAAEATINPVLIIFAIAVGLILRGAFIYWIVKNPQFFKADEYGHETVS